MSTKILSVIVPTKNRPTYVDSLISCIENQTVKPDFTILIDSSDDDIYKENQGRVSSSMLEDISIIRSKVSSASFQRNMGIAQAIDNSKFILMLDDDVSIPNDTIAKIYKVIEEIDNKYGGVGMNPEPEMPGRFAKIKKNLFFDKLGLYPSNFGGVSRSGWQGRIHHIEVDTDVSWLTTSAVLWRSKAIKSIRFNESFKKYSYLEDLDFSLTVNRNYKLKISSILNYSHLNAPEGRVSSSWFGEIEFKNRLIIVKDHKLSIISCWTMIYIRFMLTIILCFYRPEEFIPRLKGNLKFFKSNLDL